MITIFPLPFMGICLHFFIEYSNDKFKLLLLDLNTSKGSWSCLVTAATTYLSFTLSSMVSTILTICRIRALHKLRSEAFRSEIGISFVLVSIMMCIMIPSMMHFLHIYGIMHALCIPTLSIVFYGCQKIILYLIFYSFLCLNNTIRIIYLIRSYQNLTVSRISLSRIKLTKAEHAYVYKLLLQLCVYILEILLGAIFICVCKYAGLKSPHPLLLLLLQMHLLCGNLA